MEILFNIVLAITCIPACLFCYAVFSSLVQGLNPNFNEAEFNSKWQLQTFPSYAIAFFGFIGLVNVLIQSSSLATFLCYGLVIFYNLYGLYLIKHNGKELLSKLY